MKPGAKVLIVDDNEDFRLALSHVLISKGYTTCEASNGEQALVLMNSEAPDLAIVDLDMPKVNGIDFSRKVKDGNKAFPIVMVSSYSEFYSPEEVKDAGVDVFLQKPIKWEEIVGVVAKL